MTYCKIEQQKCLRRLVTTDAAALFGVFSFFLILLFLKNAQLAASAVCKGLLLCAESIVPTLFPFLFFSNILVASGVGTRLFYPLAKPLGRLFRLSSCAVTALILGAFCGFPVGAKCLSTYFDRGEVSKSEVERALPLATLASPAFLLGTVGNAIFHSQAIGGLLLAANLLSVFCVAWIGGRGAARKSEQSAPSEAQKKSPLPKHSGSRLFTDSMRAAIDGILQICAYVVIFSAISEALSSVTALFDVPDILRVFLACTVEISSGISSAESVSPRLFSFALTGFAVGWSGLSVHCQILSVTDGAGLSYRRYWGEKLWHGILCALLFCIFSRLFRLL